MNEKTKNDKVKGKGRQEERQGLANEKVKIYKGKNRGKQKKK